MCLPHKPRARRTITVDAGALRLDTTLVPLRISMMRRRPSADSGRAMPVTALCPGISV